MQRALELAAQARGRTSPNPMVGAVIIDEQGNCLAEGYHHRAGEAHGEIDALRKVNGKAEGAILYVNLEPCCHVGRTGPCTEAVIHSGIKHVVVGIQDPNPKVNGQGIAQLRDAGIKVTVGVLERGCHSLNLPYFTYIQQHRPMVSLKVAMSMDARIATRTGDARWLSGKEARRWAHQMRDQVDAILVGANTVIADNPALNVRHVEGQDPLRFVLDSHLRTPLDAQLYQPPLASGTCVCTLESTTHPKAQKLQEQGVSLLSLPADSQGHVDIQALLQQLHRQEIQQLLVEGGGTVHGNFLQARLVDRIYLVLTPWLVGADGRPAFRFTGPALLADAMQLKEMTTKPLGADILLEATPQWPESSGKER